MPVTTIGHVSVTPVKILTSATLQELRDAANKNRYKAPVPSEGWGNVRDADEAIGKAFGGRPTGNAPELIAESENAPEQFRARLFWDQLDNQAVALLGPSGDADRTHRLQATDVTISPTVEEGAYLGLLGLRQKDMISGSVIPALNRLLLSVDQNAKILQDESPIDFGDDDFFRWLLYRFHNAPKISKAIKLKDVRAIDSQDSRFRPASISKGVALDRPELLAMIGAASNKFGPAKLILSDDDLGLDVDFQLFVDGGFAAFVGMKTKYEKEPARADKGLRLVQDLAFKIIPELKSAFDADNAWRATNRDKFTESSRDRLVRALLPSGCPHCSHALP